MSEKVRDVEKMIAKVMKAKDCSRKAAEDYILLVGTGRLLALKRYDESLPEGKTTKGVFELRARKKPAKKAPRIGAAVAVEADKPKPKAKRKRARKKAPKNEEQIEIAGAAE